MILDYIGAKNLERRDLTAGQRAMIGARLEPMYAKAAKEEQRKAGREHGRGQGGKVPADSPEANRRENESREQAAKAAGSSGRSVSDAKALDTEPDLAEKVESGEMTLNTATKRRKQREAERNPKPAAPKRKPTPKPEPEAVVAGYAARSCLTASGGRACRGCP